MMEILKSIVSDKENKAKFSHAIAGVLYYITNDNQGNRFMFPVDMNDKSDVGTATFEAEIRAITLMRYIRKSIENNCLIKL